MQLALHNITYGFHILKISCKTILGQHRNEGGSNIGVNFVVKNPSVVLTMCTAY